MQKSKGQRHCEKMMERRIANERFDMCRKTVRLIMPDINLILAECYGFDDEKLRTVNEKVLKHVRMHQDTPERAKVYTEQVIEILINRYGIKPETVNALLGG